jgi:anti-sigma factor RsiW
VAEAGGKLVNCGEIARLAPLYITGELEAARAAEFDRHLRSCPSCIEEVERQARLDVRLREVIFTQETDVAEVDRRVRDLIAAEGKGHRLPRLRSKWRRRTTVAMGSAALVLLVVGYGSVGRYVPRVYADAALDHRLEVVEQQPRPWLSDLDEVTSLARQQGIAPAALRAITSKGYRLVRAKLCYLDRRSFLHLVLSDGAREISVYLRPRDETFLLGPAREIANGKPLCTSDLDQTHVASVETAWLVAVVVTGQSGEAALNFARFTAAVL